MTIFMDDLPTEVSFTDSSYAAYGDLSTREEKFAGDINGSNHGGEIPPLGDSAGLWMIDTGGTNADEFQLMPDDFKIAVLI